MAGAAMGTAYCASCGQRGCDGTCRRALDPPRFCTRCGRRLRVLITPTRSEAVCAHGCDTPGEPGSREDGAWTSS
jgi:hypothetical protein